MREKFFLGLITLQSVSLVSADVQFIDFWKKSDAFCAALFEDMYGTNGKRYARVFLKRYERVKQLMNFYQDSGPCDSRKTTPTYELVVMREFNRRHAIATNIENLTRMLTDWMNSYVCLTLTDRELGQKISGPRRSIKDIQRLTRIPEFKDGKEAFFISENAMDYDEALAYCYLQGMFLADPTENSTLYWTSLLEALDQNERYWFDNGSCRTIDRDAAIQTESCEQNNKVVCQTHRVQNECIKTESSSCEECFIGKTPELSGGRPSLKDIDIEKSFTIRFDLDCNDVPINENGGTVVDITLKEETRKTGSVNLEASSFDEILVNSSSNATSRIQSNHRTFTQLYIRPDYIFTQLYDAPGATHVFYENFELWRSIFSSSYGIPRMNYYLQGCPGDSWTLFEFKHNFDAETGLWTDMWSIDGVPSASSTYSLDTWTHERNFHLGMSTSDFTEAKTNIRNFCQTHRVQNECIKTESSSCEECFIGTTPELSGGRPSLKDIDIEKSFKIRFDLDCNDVSIFDNGGTVVDITLKEETRKTGSFKYEASSIDEILVNSSSNATSRIQSNDRTFTQLFIRPDWIFTQLYDAPGSTHVFYENFELHRSIFSGSYGIPRMNYYLQGCPGDNWTLFEFKHNFDAETGLWTDMWTIDGVPLASSTYSLDTWTHERNFHLGMSTSNFAEAKTNIRNFCYSSI